MYRKHKSEAPRGDWQRMATEARRRTTQPPKLVFKGDYKIQNGSAPNKPARTRTSIIRGMNNTQRIPNEEKEPDTNKMKWKYGDVRKAASTNVRGLRDPVKREEISTQMETNGVDIMRLQETKIPDACYEVRKGFVFAFSSTSIEREHSGVGFCYKRYIEKCKNYYRQVSSNLIAMELIMHGSPLIRNCIGTYPHDSTNDDRIRQRAWEDLANFITETLDASNTPVLGDLNTNMHARKEEEEGHIGPHIYGRGVDFLRDKVHNTPANKTTNREYMINRFRATNMKVANTYYQKLDEFKGTYQRKDNVDGGPPWSTDRYCDQKTTDELANKCTSRAIHKHKHRPQIIGNKSKTETEST